MNPRTPASEMFRKFAGVTFKMDEHSIYHIVPNVTNSILAEIAIRLILRAINIIRLLKIDI